MYGLPKDFDGDFLVGRILEMICFNANQVYLHFDSKTHIQIESSLSYGDAQRVDVPVRQPTFLDLLECSVVSARGDEEGTLTLSFSNGRVLRIYEETKQYECYTIRYGGTEIIV